MQRRLLTLGLAMGLMAGLAGGVMSQDDGESLLGGPSVTIEADAPTLVERDYEGRLRELDTRPEVAAIGLLGLTDAERQNVDALVLERAKLVDAIVFDNLDLLTQLQTVRSNAQAGQGAGEGTGRGMDESQRATVREFFQAVAPLREQEPLVDHFAAALPEAKRETYRALVREWNEAQAAEAAGDESQQRRRRGPGGQGSRGPVRGADMAAIRIEMRAAYDRGVADRTQRLDSLIDRLELTPEQEGEVRAMIRAFGEANGQNPTQAQRAELMRQILATLEPEQRRAAIERMRADRP